MSHETFTLLSFVIQMVFIGVIGSILISKLKKIEEKIDSLAKNLQEREDKD